MPSQIKKSASESMTSAIALQKYLSTPNTALAVFYKRLHAVLVAAGK